MEEEQIRDVMQVVRVVAELHQAESHFVRLFVGLETNGWKLTVGETVRRVGTTLRL